MRKTEKSGAWWRRSRASGRRRGRSSAHRWGIGACDGLPYGKCETLLSRGEAAFHGALAEAIGDQCLVMCKVRVADVMTCAKEDWRRGHGGAISQKHLDFVLCERVSTRVILAIELDDRSHEAEHRKRRDAFLNKALRSASVPLLRIRARSRYSPEIIRRLVFAAVSRGYRKNTRDGSRHTAPRPCHNNRHRWNATASGKEGVVCRRMRATDQPARSATGV